MEIRFGMLAHRTDIRRFFANNNVSAVAAVPNLITIAGEHQSALNVGKEFAVALFVFFFDLADPFKESGDLIQPFFFRGLGKTGVHIGPLEVFPVRRVFKVRRGRRHFAAVQELDRKSVV